MVNKDELARMNLEAPQDWQDLLKEEYSGGGGLIAVRRLLAVGLVIGGRRGLVRRLVVVLAAEAKIEEENGNPSADVWFGGTTDPYNVVAAEGLLEAYDAANRRGLVRRLVVVLAAAGRQRQGHQQDKQQR